MGQKPAEIQTTVLSQIKTASTTKTVTTRQITTVTTATTAPPPQPTEPPTPKPQILDYDRLDDQMQTFIDGYDIDYNWLYEKGANLTHDGTDYGKAVAIRSTQSHRNICSSMGIELSTPQVRNLLFPNIVLLLSQRFLH